MSDLVLMLWLVDVASASHWFGFLGYIGAWVIIVWSYMQKMAKEANIDDAPSPPKSWIAICVAMLLIAWLMPSKNTLYAAIALKAGHEIAESRIGYKAVTALDGVLDEVIAKQAKEKK